MYVALLEDRLFQHGTRAVTDRLALSLELFEPGAEDARQ
jgi:hypothetical protein